MRGMKWDSRVKEENSWEEIWGENAALLAEAGKRGGSNASFIGTLEGRDPR